MQSSKKKKILFLMQLPPPVHGAAVMNQSIQDSELINSTFDCNYINISTAKGINDIGKGSLGKWFRSLGLLIRVKLSIFTFRPNLVYITLSPVGFAFYKDSFFVLISRFFGRKICIHLHGKGIENAMNTKFKMWYYNYVFKGSDTIHLSKLLLPELNKISTIKKPHILNNGIKDRSIPKFEHKGINIVYLSNMVESKGAMILLKAAKVLFDKGITDFQVNFAGQWYEPEFKNDFLNYLESNQMSKYCQFHGPLYGEDKQKYLASADIFVLPTRYPNECFPLVLLEAMSYGLPIISSDEGAISEIVETNGFIMKSNNELELSESIEKLIIDDNTRLQYSEQSRNTYLKKYQVEGFETNVKVILDEVTKEA